MNPQTGGAKITDALSRTQETAIQFDGAEASAVLAKAAAWLAKLGQTRGFTLEQRYVSIDLVDTSTRQHQQRALDDYLALPPTQRVQEKLLWEAAHGFWAALSSAYVDGIAAAQADADATAKLGVRLPLLAARGARAIALQIKWIAFRYGLVEPWVWSNLARCLQFAEANDIAGKAAPLYRSDAGPISTEQAFLRAVMLQVSDTESLSPMEQEMVSRLIDHFTSDFKLDRRAQEDLTHYFDLDHALPPRRVLGAPGKAARRRYLGALDEKSWSLGLIRRVETDEHRQRKVGIRVIARNPVAAVLRLLAQTPGRHDREEPGILLNTRPSGNGGVHVLIRPGTFTLQDEIEAHFGTDHAQALTLKPTNTVQATLDYAWVRYEVKR